MEIAKLKESLTLSLNSAYLIVLGIANHLWRMQMDRMQWIKDLILAEQQMEDTGMVDFSVGFDTEVTQLNETLFFLNDLKSRFVESCAAFNQLKGSSLGTIKIYGISKTKADFMLFRNGFKLIFTMKKPGQVNVILNHIGVNFLPDKTTKETEIPDQDVLVTQWGAFGELRWFFKQAPIQSDHLIKYYLSKFVRESSK